MLKLAKKSVPADTITFSAVLAGNPNAGKTTLFNALTHSRLKTGNFHGVTTVPAEKRDGGIVFKDVPGMYSLNSYTMEEVSAAEAAKSADVIINVVDSLTLESSLNLTRRLVSLNPNTIVYLTKLQLLKRRKGWVNEEKLSAFLGVPVLSCPPEQLKQKVKSICAGGMPPRTGKSGKIAFTEAYYGGNQTLSAAEKLFYNKYFALLFFAAALVFTFFITFHPAMPGAYLKNLLTELICVKLSAAAEGAIENAALSSFVCEGIIGGVGGVLSFIPQITILYIVLIALDESGISSALSFVTDGLFEKVGLSGRAAFSLVSGFGCTAAAIATTRGYREESARKRTIAVLPYIPCGAKTPVFLTFLSPVFKNPFPAICALYFSGLALAIVISWVLSKIEKKRGGAAEGQICEVTPIAFPPIKQVVKKLYFQVQSFIIKVATYVFAFCVISWLLSHISFTQGFCRPSESILGAVSKLALIIFYPLGITDWRIAYAALTGFAAKENVAATIALLIPEGLSLTVAQSIGLGVFFLCCPACISAFAASVREIGFKKTLLYNGVQLAAACLFSYVIFLLMCIF